VDSFSRRADDRDRICRFLAGAGRGLILLLHPLLLTRRIRRAWLPGAKFPVRVFLLGSAARQYGAAGSLNFLSSQGFSVDCGSGLGSGRCHAGGCTGARTQTDLNTTTIVLATPLGVTDASWLAGPSAACRCGSFDCRSLKSTAARGPARAESRTGGKVTSVHSDFGPLIRLFVGQGHVVFVTWAPAEALARRPRVFFTHMAEQVVRASMTIIG